MKLKLIFIFTVLVILFYGISTAFFTCPSYLTQVNGVCVSDNYGDVQIETSPPSNIIVDVGDRWEITIPPIPIPAYTKVTGFETNRYTYRPMVWINKKCLICPPSSTAHYFDDLHAGWYLSCNENGTQPPFTIPETVISIPEQFVTLADNTVVSQFPRAHVRGELANPKILTEICVYP